MEIQETALPGVGPRQEFTTATAGDLATSSGARFDRWASTYDSSPLQPTLFAPVHQTALQLAAHLVPDARRVLDVGCGTGRLLRQARQRYRPAELVGVDLARGMLAAAIAATTTELRIHYLHAGAEHLPFTDEMFDLVFATMTMRHWTDQAAGIAEIGRVLTPGGVLVLADVFPSSPRRTLLASLLLRRRRPSLPGQLDAALTAHRLTLVGYDRTPWFSLPDAQVVATQRQSTARPPFEGVGRPRRVGPLRALPPSAGRHRQLPARVGPRWSEQ
jgi:SAM-dependent methyltransferase